MNIEATIIKDSISSSNKRITTFHVTLPKVLLSEFNTHRVFSRNFSSSRAIPVSKLSKQDSFIPLYWGKNQPGMSSKEEEIENREEAERIWNDAIEYCREASLQLSKLGLHKQWSNRLNDWHTMCKGIVTSTEWDNFFQLRCDKAAQPEMENLACKMRDALEQSIPDILSHGEWHLPFITKEEMKLLNKTPYILWVLQKISSARCCRVSYLNHEGKETTLEEDLALFDRLANGGHMSPLEHQATPDSLISNGTKWEYPSLHGNLNGWRQFRKIWEYANQNREKYD